MKWLIIGTGWISDDFIEALKCCGQEVVAVCSRSNKRAREFALKHNIKYYSNNLDIIAPYCDAIYVATPNTTHYDIAVKSISLKKKLMIEKPMTHSYKFTKHLYSLSFHNNVKIMEAYTHITRNEIENIKPGNIVTSFKHKVTDISNNQYKKMSAFSKECFGGVIPDLGVYPISLSIYINGNVKNMKIANVKFLNNVEVECDIELEHEKFVSTISISLLVEGENNLLINDKLILDNITRFSIKKGCHKMCAEISLFTSKKSLEKIKEVSIETSRVVEKLKSLI